MSLFSDHDLSVILYVFFTDNIREFDAENENDVQNLIACIVAAEESVEGNYYFPTDKCPALSLYCALRRGVISWLIGIPTILHSDSYFLHFL
jgi:hypothetical protein